MNEICAPVLNLVNRLGEMALFLSDAVRQTWHCRRLAGKVLQQVYVIGAKSMFVILLIGLFTGLVLGLQAFYAMSMFGAQGMLGSLLALTLIREMAPVLTAVMVTARAGSAMTAEIGVMRISDQVDALEVMDINPVGYMVTPRLLASVITFPLLTAIFTVVGIFGGYLSACVLLGLNEGRYFSGIESSVTLHDVEGCFLKAAVFAVIVITVCCFQGYNAHRRSDGKGAEAVGNATTSAVVMSCVLILMADYVLTSFLL
ncbi:MlaE family ABC transporter permease [Mailhella massiliensis]|uniref:MlaE family ABC transporter permease n=1 Tax=Mailhella massiliensis TaxID=1903261 RepID=UPI00097D3C68|nr:ABC transporter permease [Mailhella massiliensis]